MNALDEIWARASRCTRNGASLATRGGGAPARCEARISWKNCSSAVCALQGGGRVGVVSVGDGRHGAGEVSAYLW